MPWPHTPRRGCPSSPARPSASLALIWGSHSADLHWLVGPIGQAWIAQCYFPLCSGLITVDQTHTNIVPSDLSLLFSPPSPLDLWFPTSPHFFWDTVKLVLADHSQSPSGCGGGVGAATEQAGMCSCLAQSPSRPQSQGGDRWAGAEVMLPKREGEPKSSLWHAVCRPAKLIKTKGGSTGGAVTRPSVRGQSAFHVLVWPRRASRLQLRVAS